MATGIATFGLLLDSTAAVIGAMIVAPLMLPIMGLAFAISLGDGRAVVSSVLVALTGMVVVVGVGCVLAIPLSGLLEPKEIGQIMVRTAPRLLDLIAAVVIGLAGAFAMGRKDVSDTLPGVAIAVSLVPPLANTGILLAFGEVQLALGSLLLFLANYVAILFSGTLVFRIMGFGLAFARGADGQAHRKGAWVSALGVFVVALPLGVASYDIAVKTSIKRTVTKELKEWLADGSYRLAYVESETADVRVKVLLKGSGILPPIDDLEERLSGRLAGRELEVEVIEVKSFQIKPPAQFEEWVSLEGQGILERAYYTLQTDDWEELAKVCVEAEAYLTVLKSVEELKPYVDWLEQRLDYYQIVEEAVRQVPGDGRDEGWKRAISKRITDFDLWKNRVAPRPVPGRAEALTPLLRRVFIEEGVPPELIWVAEVESTFNPAARSPVGALGLFQLMPATAKSLGLRVTQVDERLDPERNARAAARYLRQLYRRFGSWELALAAYNGGQGRVSRLLRQQPGAGFAQIAPYLPAETRMYVPKVMAIISLREGRLPG
ncbi:MAG TPA: DUF389 domain-containing protein [Kiritimatiellia bacterium]|nr:DUF389 domain-containing protein [Kiritimatiellia bacterium]